MLSNQLAPLRHGYRTPRDAARRAVLSGGGGDAGVAAVRKDEEGRECFIIGSEYESEYPWPGEEWEEWEAGAYSRSLHSST